MLEGKTVGADNEVELELFKSVSFTNALVLKINQLAKQVKKHLSYSRNYKLRLLVKKRFFANEITT